MKPFRHILFGEGIETPQAIQAMLLSLLISCGILFGGMFQMWRVGSEANKIDHQLYHAREGLAAMRQAAQAQKESKQ